MNDWSEIKGVGPGTRSLRLTSKTWRTPPGGKKGQVAARNW